MTDRVAIVGLSVVTEAVLQQAVAAGVESVQSVQPELAGVVEQARCSGATVADAADRSEAAEETGTGRVAIAAYSGASLMAVERRAKAVATAAVSIQAGAGSGRSAAGVSTDASGAPCAGSAETGSDRAAGRT